ncbi:MAG: D-alanyl-D-alanine dipeptidase [Saprospiraceae bacterium]
MRLYSFLILLFFACATDQSAEKKSEAAPTPEQPTEKPAELKPSTKDAKSVDEIEAAPETTAPAPTLPSASKSVIAPAQPSGNGFSDVAALDPSIKLDIKYATADNFTKSKIYDCPRCLLRPEAADAVVAAHKALKKRGLGLKMFDCYRPRPYQQRLWDKVPNPDYVTPPAKGSMHSRGAAVDLTIVDANGKELDMGTPYDYFGREAHTDNYNLPQKVLANRRILREAMESVGFKGIRTEWWHFSFQGKNWPLSNYVWPCDK